MALMISAIATHGDTLGGSCNASAPSTVSLHFETVSESWGVFVNSASRTR